MPKDFLFFSDKELRCPCCKQNFMDTPFMLELIRIREIADFPFNVTSAYRCPNYNDRISTTGRDGPHTTGHAVDILVTGRKTVILLKLVLKSEFFTGIGINQRGPRNKRFIHIDNLEATENRPRPWLWTY